MEENDFFFSLLFFCSMNVVKKKYVGIFPLLITPVYI